MCSDMIHCRNGRCIEATFKNIIFTAFNLDSRTATAAKVRRIQGSQLYDRKEETSRTEELTDAERAIRTVSEKLRSDLSVEYTVNE